MPIIALYTWSEKRDTIKVLVPLKGVSAAKADVLVSGSTLKVNFAPYILDIVLLKEIDSIKHKASVKEGVLNITLFKKESGLWGALEAEGSKEELLAVKRDAVAAQSALNENLDVQRSDRKLAEEKHSLRKQMKLEELERTRVDNVKQEEKEAAEKEVYDAFAEMHMKSNDGKGVSTTTKNKVKPTTTVQKAALTVVDKSKQIFDHADPAVRVDESGIDLLLEADDIDEAVVESKPSPAAIFKSDVKSSGGAVKHTLDASDFEEYDDADIDETLPSNTQIVAAKHNRGSAAVHEVEYEEVEEDEVRYIPPPRSSGLSENAEQKIGISFTPRVFPTPMRESKAAEKEDWVAKNRRHIKKHGVLGKSEICICISFLVYFPVILI